MRIYFGMQILRVLLMSFTTPDGAEGASRCCDACRGETSAKICRDPLKKKQRAFHHCETQIGGLGTAAFA